MYEIDAKFFGDDGSLDTEMAMTASRKARAQAAGEGFAFVVGGVKGLIQAGKHAVARSGVFQNSSTTAT